MANDTTVNVTGTTDVKPVVPGWRTTEFWAVVATSITAILNQAFDWKISNEAVMTIAGIVASYVFGRAITKK